MKNVCLNPDFMYEFIRQICRANGYMVMHFNLVQLSFQCRPPYLENGEDFNYGYETIIYRPKSKPNLKKLSLKEDKERGGDYCTLSIKDIHSLLEFKVLYFDISCECFHIEDVFLDNNSKNPTYENLTIGNNDYLGMRYTQKLFWPTFIQDKGVYYYGIYTYPSVHKEQYLREEFEIWSADYLWPDELLPSLFDCNRKSPEATQKVFNELVKEYNHTLRSPRPLGYFGNREEYNKKKPSYAKILPLQGYDDDTHTFDYPIFYTSNALELTIPLAEAIEKLGGKISGLTYHISKQMTTLSYAICNIHLDLVSTELRLIAAHLHNADAIAGGNLNSWKGDAGDFYREEARLKANTIVDGASYRARNIAIQYQDDLPKALNTYKRLQRNLCLNQSLENQLNSFAQHLRQKNDKAKDYYLNLDTIEEFSRLKMLPC